MKKELKALDTIYNIETFDEEELLKCYLLVRNKLKSIDKFEKYITELYNHRNDWEKNKKVIKKEDIRYNLIRSSIIETIYSIFMEVLNNDKQKENKK